MIDRYTKIVLTVIAAALCVLVAQNSTPRAHAQLGSSECGAIQRPCYITTFGAIEVRVAR